MTEIQVIGHFDPAVGVRRVLRYTNDRLGRRTKTTFGTYSLPLQDPLSHTVANALGAYGRPYEQYAMYDSIGRLKRVVDRLPNPS